MGFLRKVSWTQTSMGHTQPKDQFLFITDSVPTVYLQPTAHNCQLISHESTEFRVLLKNLQIWQSWAHSYRPAIARAE